MYVRCAYFEGDVAPADREAFDACIDREVVPLMAQFPNVRDIRVLRGREFEDDAPHHYLVLEHTYDSPEHLEEALASDLRVAVWERLSEVMPLFKGRVVHVNFEAAVAPIAT